LAAIEESENPENLETMDDDFFDNLDSDNPHVGSTLDSLLEDDGILADVNSAAKTKVNDWLSAFDKDDLQSLVKELIEAMQLIDPREDGFKELQSVIHEWQESARAIQSNEVSDDEPDEVPLTNPCEERIAVSEIIQDYIDDYVNEFDISRDELPSVIGIDSELFVRLMHNDEPWTDELLSKVCAVVGGSPAVLMRIQNEPSKVQPFPIELHDRINALVGDDAIDLDAPLLPEDDD
jgi:superfamily I DNA/RNA helicase